SPSSCRGAGERDGSQLTLSSNVEQGEAGFGTLALAQIARRPANRPGGAGPSGRSFRQGSASGRAARAQSSSLSRGGRGASPGISILEAVFGHLLQLLLCPIERQAIVVGFDVAQRNGHVLASHSEEGADIDDKNIDF